MSQVPGDTVGNALEVGEAVGYLTVRRRDPRLHDVVTTLSRELPSPGGPAQQVRHHRHRGPRFSPAGSGARQDESRSDRPDSDTRSRLQAIPKRCRHSSRRYRQVSSARSSTTSLGGERSPMRTPTSTGFPGASTKIPDAGRPQCRDAPSMARPHRGYFERSSPLPWDPRTRSDGLTPIARRPVELSTSRLAFALPLPPIPRLPSRFGPSARPPLPAHGPSMARRGGERYVARHSG